MKLRLSTLAGLLVAAGASAAIAVAPLATAAPDPTMPQCEDTGGSSVEGGQTTLCESPGNAQIDATPPEPSYGMFPWDDEFFVL